MARHTLANFRAGDRNTIAIFDSINNSLQRGLAAQAAVNNQVIDLSTQIRSFRNQDREFKFRVDNEIYNRKRERLLDTLKVAEFDHKNALTNAQIAQTHASSVRTRAQSAALRGDIEESRRLHTRADEMEETVFAGLETRSFTTQDIIEELRGTEGADDSLRRMMEEVGIEIPEDIPQAQPVQGIDPIQPINGSPRKDENIDANGKRLFPEPGEPVPVPDEGLDTDEPSPQEKLQVIRGVQGPQGRDGIKGFGDISTQQDLDEWVKLAGIDPASKEGQAAIARVIPQTSFGREQEARRQEASKSYLNQALMGSTTDREASIEYYTDTLGGSRPLYETASRIGENYRGAQKTASETSQALLKANDAMKASLFQANVQAETGADGSVDLNSIDAGEIKTATERKAVADAKVAVNAASRSNLIAQIQLQAAEEDYLQFQIDAGLLPKDTLDKLEEAQQAIEEADARPAPEPEVDPESIVNDGRAEVSLADFQADVLAESTAQSTGLESKALRSQVKRNAAATSLLLEMDPLGRFGYEVTDQKSLADFRNSRDVWFAQQRLKAIAEHGLDLESPEDDDAITHERLVFRKGYEWLWDDDPTFVPPTVEEQRAAAEVAKGYIKKWIPHFNSLSNGDRRDIIDEAYQAIFGKGSHVSSMEFSTSPGKNARVELGLNRSAGGELKLENIDHGNVILASHVAALLEAKRAKRIIDENIIDENVNWDAFNKVHTERLRRREISNNPQPINELPPDLETVGEEQPPTAQEIAGELGVNPQTLRDLQFPEIKGQEVDGAVEEDLEETTSPQDKQTDGEVKENAAAISSKAEAIVANGTKPTKPLGSYGVTTQTRDQIPDFDRLRRTRNVISMDFNHDGRRNSASKALIVVPNDASDELIKAATDYIKLMSKEYGIPVAHGGKHGKGIRTRSENGRGLTRVTHLEGFYGNDPVTVAAIRRDPNKYANILKLTFGRMHSAVFIPPHTQATKGAATNDGEFETDFAIKHIIPHLKA